MPLANTKKAQTIRNLWWLRVAKPIAEGNAMAAAIREAILANDLADQFSLAERNAMQAVETAILGPAGLPGVTVAESKYVPSHRNKAITITGVNDG